MSAKTTEYVPKKSSTGRVFMLACEAVAIVWAGFYYVSQPAVKDACREGYEKGVQLSICDTLLLLPSENQEFAELRAKGGGITNDNSMTVGALPDNIFDEEADLPPIPKKRK